MSVEIEVGKSYLTWGGDQVEMVVSVPLSKGGHLFVSSDDVVYNYLGYPQQNGSQVSSDQEIKCLASHEEIVKIANVNILKALNKTFSREIGISDIFDALRIWGEMIFGEGDAVAIANRAQKEMNELHIAAVDGWTEKSLEEAADVILLLSRAPNVWSALVRKMTVNIDRKWELHGDGTGTHVKTTNSEG